MTDEIYFGFGHYLRRVKLPGTYYRDERNHGFDVTFYGKNIDDFTLECEILYGVEGFDSVLGNNYAKCAAKDIECFEIGGSSVVRYAEAETIPGKWHAEAEVVIKDEVYRFAAASASRDRLRILHDALKGAISVEDWYDSAFGDENPDPHANGATFCINGLLAEPCEYLNIFPYAIGIFDIPAAVKSGQMNKADLSIAAQSIMSIFEKVMNGDVSLDDESDDDDDDDDDDVDDFLEDDTE